MKTRKLFIIFLLFLLVVSSAVLNKEKVYAEDNRITFEILSEGDIVYDGSDEPITLQTTIPNNASYLYEIKFNGEDVTGYCSLDYETKELVLSPTLLRSLRKGTSTFTLTVIFDDDDGTSYDCSVDFDVISPYLADYSADLIINDKDHPAMYSKDDQIGSDIEGLKVIKPGQDSDTYIIELEKDVELTSINEGCIIAQHGCSLQIVGPYTLTINLESKDDIYAYCSAIETSKDFILGDKNSSNVTSLVINDVFAIHNNDKDKIHYAYYHGIWSKGMTRIYNSNIIGNITTDLFISREGIEIENSKIKHNVYANFTLETGTSRYATTILNSDGMVLIDNSNIETKVVESDSYENISMTFISVSFDDTVDTNDVSLCIKNSDIKFNPIPYHTDDCYSYFIDSRLKTIIENSTIKVNNTTRGIMVREFVEIINSDVQIDAINSGIVCFDNLTFTYNDKKEHIIDLSVNRQQDVDYEKYFPSIYLFLLDPETEEMIEASTDLIEIDVPEDVKLFSGDEMINKEDIFSYDSFYFKTKEEKNPSKPEQKKDSKHNFTIPKTGII